MVCIDQLIGENGRRYLDFPLTHISLEERRLYMISRNLYRKYINMFLLPEKDHDEKNQLDSYFSLVDGIGTREMPLLVAVPEALATYRALYNDYETNTKILAESNSNMFFPCNKLAIKYLG